MSKAKPIERLRRILALANGSNHEGEVANAMRMARKIMLEHDISESDIEDESDQQFGVIKVHTSSTVWKRLLTSKVAKFFGLAVCYDKGKKLCEVYGKIDHLEPFRLCMAMAISDIESRTKHIPRKGRTSYRTSMVAGIDSVLQQINAIEHAETGIVLANALKAGEYMRTQVSVETRKANTYRYQHSVSAFQQGQEIGRKIKGESQC